MSIKILSHVWEHSEQHGGALLVMLALADFADDDGFCWPAVTTLATKARMSERNVRYLLRSLEAAGEIETTPLGGWHGTSGYAVKPGAKVAGGQKLPGAKRRTKGGKTRHRGGQPIAPEPSDVSVSDPSKGFNGGTAAAPDGGAAPDGDSGPATGSKPRSADSPPPADSMTPAERDRAAAESDRWWWLKDAIASTITGRPDGCRKVDGTFDKRLLCIVGDLGRLAADDPTDAEAIWEKFVADMTPKERERHVRLDNDTLRNWLGRWARGSGAEWIRQYLEYARNERAKAAHQALLYRNTVEVFGVEVARDNCQLPPLTGDELAAEIAYWTREFPDAIWLDPPAEAQS